MVSSCQQLEQTDWNYVEIKIWIKYSSISKWHNLKGTKHLVMGQKEGYLKREMTIKRKKYILLGIISNSTLTFLPLQLNSLRFLEFRGSLLTILARLWILRYCKLRRYKLRHNVTPCYPLVTHHSPTHFVRLLQPLAARDLSGPFPRPARSLSALPPNGA